MAFATNDADRRKIAGVSVCSRCERTYLTRGPQRLLTRIAKAVNLPDWMFTIPLATSVKAQDQMASALTVNFTTAYAAIQLRKRELAQALSEFRYAAASRVQVDYDGLLRDLKTLAAHASRILKREVTVAPTVPKARSNGHRAQA
jgi:hypothetical protein